MDEVSDRIRSAACTRCTPIERIRCQRLDRGRHSRLADRRRRYGLQFGFTAIILSKQVVHQRVIARYRHENGRVGRTRRPANTELTADDQQRSVYDSTRIIAYK
jgi:hypothetical protein